MNDSNCCECTPEIDYKNEYYRLIEVAAQLENENNELKNTLIEMRKAYVKHTK
jgi:hypothetical protein